MTATGCFVSDLSTKFNGSFLENLQKMNDSNLGSKHALILISQSDYNNCFTKRPLFEFSLLQIAKIYHVGIHIINNNKIKEIIDSESKKIDAKIDLLLLVGHGEPKSINFDLERYSEEDVKEDDFESLSEDGDIFLFSCLTGKSLAQKVADISNRRVFAPMESIKEPGYLFICEEHKKIEFQIKSTKDEPFIFEFSKNNHPFSCDIKKDYKTQLLEKLQYLENDGTPYANFDLGIYYYDQGDFPSAIEYLEKAIPLDNKKVYYFLGLANYQLNKISLAKKWFLKSANENHSDSQYYLGRIFYSKGNIPKAVFWLEKSIMGCTDRKIKSDAEYLLGVLYEKMEMEDDAIAFYATASILGHLKASFNLGKLYYYKGDFVNAEKYLLLCSNDENSEAQYLLATIFERTKEKKKLAIDLYEKAATAKVPDPNAQYSLASYLEDQGNIPEAIKFYSLADLNGNAEAKKDLDRLSKEKPTHPSKRKKLN